MQLEVYNKLFSNSKQIDTFTDMMDPHRLLLISQYFIHAYFRPKIWAQSNVIFITIILLKSQILHCSNLVFCFKNGFHEFFPVSHGYEIGTLLFTHCFKIKSIYFNRIPPYPEQSRFYGFFVLANLFMSFFSFWPLKMDWGGISVDIKMVSC